MKTYIFNNQQVVLLYDTEVQEINNQVSPLSDYGCNINPYTLTDEVRGWIEQGVITPCASYDECYCGVSDNEEEIIHARVRNIENGQHLIEEWITKSYAISDEAIRELCATTDSYCDWTSERKKMFDKIYDLTQSYEDDELREELATLRQEWEEIVDNYDTSDVDDDYSWEGLIKEVGI